MEGLLGVLLELISSWDKLFLQARTAARARVLALSLLATLGRKTLSRAICAAQRENQDWSADYRLFSRCEWQCSQLFSPMLERGCSLIDDKIIAIGYDDTLVHKTGKRIKGSSWQRDPLSPPFTVNFVWGIRYLQASLLLPLYQKKSMTPPRAIPIQFEQLPHFKKPSKKAPQEQWQEYKKLKAQHNTSTCYVQQLQSLRQELDHLGLNNKTLLSVCDGSFCNRTCFLADVERTQVIARTRKNARLYFRNPEPSRLRFYQRDGFTPEQIRQNETITYLNAEIFYGGAYRTIRFKEVKEVYWKETTKRKPLRLIVIAPAPYRRDKKGHLCYRQPAYLLTTDLTTPVTTLIQKYFDRWQIEVNFQEEKGLMGLGHQQVWSEKSIPRLPAFIASIYSAVLLSSVLHFNDQRQGEAFEQLPKWRRKDPQRPSCLDLLTILRKEITQRSLHFKGLGMHVTKTAMVLRAAA